jgi:excisionase family DNA binding protein
MSPSDYLLLTEAAELARVPLATVRWWVSQNRIRSYKPGRHRLIKRADLIAFIEASATTASNGDSQ